MSDSVWPHRLYSPWDSPGRNPGLGSISLLRGIFPTQGSNTGLSHCRLTLYQLSHQGSPRILEWVAFPFSRGSSQPRDWTQVACIAGRFFTRWTTREANYHCNSLQKEKKKEVSILINQDIFFSQWQALANTHQIVLKKREVDSSCVAFRLDKVHVPKH